MIAPARPRDDLTGSHGRTVPGSSGPMPRRPLRTRSPLDKGTTGPTQRSLLRRRKPMLAAPNLSLGPAWHLPHSAGVPRLHDLVGGVLWRGSRGCVALSGCQEGRPVGLCTAVRRPYHKYTAARTRPLSLSSVISRTPVTPSPSQQGVIFTSSTRRQRRGRRQRMSPSWCMLRQLRRREAWLGQPRSTAFVVSPIDISCGRSRRLLPLCRVLIADGV